MNIAISGMTCSGKTTLSNRILNEICNVSIMHEDDYFKDLHEVAHAKGYYLLDSPNAFHTLEFINDSMSLINNGVTNIPLYDVKNNRRVNKDRFLKSSNINVFEGLHTISLLKDKVDLKIFIDTDIETCIRRRIERDKAYGMYEDKIRDYFDKIIIPLYKSYIKPQINDSNIVIRKEDDINCLLKKLANY